VTIRRSLAFAFADKTASTFMSVVSMAVVSRVLTPAEVGLFVVAITIIMLVEGFRDFGVANCIIQEPELTPELVRTAFTLMAAMSAVLALAIFLAAPALAAFYGDDKLATLIRIATVAFLFAPFSTPLLALMRRDLHFGAIARINVSAAFVSAVATIGLALAGFGAQSLVFASVLMSLTTLLGALWSRPEFWVFRPCLVAWRRVTAFGVWSNLSVMLAMFYDTFPRLIIGRLLGFGAVGIFTRAVSITQLPARLVLQAVQPVVLPALAARGQARSSLAEGFLRGQSYICVLQWPALVTLALLAHPVVMLLLGDQWIQTVPLVRIVALASLSLFPGYLAFPALVAVGRVQDQAWSRLVAVPFCMGLVTLATHWGLEGVAFSLFLSGPIQIGVTLWFLKRHLPFAWRDLARVFGDGAVVSLATAALPLLTILSAREGAALDLLDFALAVCGAAIGWIVGLRMVSHPITGEIVRAIGEMQRMLGRRSRQAP
jgi:O-antigen/teichoic acid export membrane protein